MDSCRGRHYVCVGGQGSGRRGGMQGLEKVRQADEDAGVPIIVLAHNEVNLVTAFLNHYRRLCTPHFVVVDDGSTDGTPEHFAAQPDVTLFRPAPGSSYAADKHIWRQGLLDTHADGRWALTPDMDEFFVFAGRHDRLEPHLRDLDHEGAEAVLTVMLDMYADRPLRDHSFDSAGGRTLFETFPYFDGPSPAPFGYHFLHNSRKRRRKLPTPPLSVHGGMRDRLFRAEHTDIGALRGWLLDRVAGLDGPVTPEGVSLLKHVLARPFIRAYFRQALDMHKIGLVRWRRGLNYGGAHCLRQRLPLSESIAAFLHYKFTRGLSGLQYTARRGQHFAGARHYHQMLAAEDILGRSPVFEGSRRFVDISSLAGIARAIPAG
ncbi:hypothetical protein FAZ78_01855 [Cereibacter changlensis]|uniref:Glycosyltransferase family 2 protein n=1 Tax=Cereibacter changlensis TaxID=402884 RepID=A0A4U0Z6M2_9RHOB|nr:hypothetical protein FAZ78_01855 [Cereibacter changlensis]